MSNESKVSMADMVVPQEEPQYKPDPNDPHPIATAMYFSQNSITFAVDNSNTDFTLNAQSTFADWGNFSGNPSNVSGHSKENNSCKVTASHAPFTGSAGVIGYKVTSGNDTIYLRLAATNPYMSARSNRTMAKIVTDESQSPINQGGYNAMYNDGGDTSHSFAGKTFKITSNIGDADQATATFVMKWE